MLILHRCIVTEHEAFILFNVYVPNDSKDFCRLGFKMRFLEALKKQMDRARNETGKPIMLVGDLNICHRCALESDINPF